jgi:hypothetical protein
MTDPTPCLIVDCTEAYSWPGRHGCARLQAVPMPQQIPAGKRPTILQPSREIAEAEVKRLALAYPERRFVVFEAAAACTTVTVPTHTTINGRPWGERRVAVLMDIGEDDGIPF